MGHAHGVGVGGAERAPVVRWRVVHAPHRQRVPGVFCNRYGAGRQYVLLTHASKLGNGDLGAVLVALHRAFPELAALALLVEALVTRVGVLVVCVGGQHGPLTLGIALLRLLCTIAG